MYCAMRELHAKEHYDWARQSKKPTREGLAGQFQAAERKLSVNQEEAFAHVVENQDLPAEVDIDEDLVDRF
jgi:hypothetical protein